MHPFGHLQKGLKRCEIPLVGDRSDKPAHEHLLVVAGGVTFPVEPFEMIVGHVDYLGRFDEAGIVEIGLTIAVEVEQRCDPADDGPHQDGKGETGHRHIPGDDSEGGDDLQSEVFGHGLLRQFIGEAPQWIGGVASRKIHRGYGVCLKRFMWQGVIDLQLLRWRYLAHLTIDLPENLSFVTGQIHLVDRFQGKPAAVSVHALANADFSHLIEGVDKIGQIAVDRTKDEQGAGEDVPLFKVAISSQWRQQYQRVRRR